MSIVRHYTTWADQRLAEAYDLIYEVAREHGNATDKLPELLAVCDEVEKADDLLAGVLRDRMDERVQRARAHYAGMAREVRHG